MLADARRRIFLLLPEVLMTDAVLVMVRRPLS